MGVVGSSPMNGLIGFHPILSLPPDIMHDIAEGVCPIVMVGILKEASAMRLLTYGKNHLIRSRVKPDFVTSVFL